MEPRLKTLLQTRCRASGLKNVSNAEVNNHMRDTLRALSMTGFLTALYQRLV